MTLLFSPAGEDWLSNVDPQWFCNTLEAHNSFVPLAHEGIWQMSLSAFHQWVNILPFCEQMLHFRTALLSPHVCVRHVHFYSIRRGACFLAQLSPIQSGGESKQKLGGLLCLWSFWVSILPRWCWPVLSPGCGIFCSKSKLVSWSQSNVPRPFMTSFVTFPHSASPDDIGKSLTH